MQIRRAADDEPMAGPAEWFTGEVEVAQLFGAPDPSRLGHALVTFRPGARTAWHTHPVGQLLFIHDGTAWVAGADGQRQEVHRGDVVWFEAGERHWHGATTDDPMTHVSVNESVAGSAVEWHEHVTDDDYLA